MAYSNDTVTANMKVHKFKTYHRLAGLLIDSMRHSSLCISAQLSVQNRSVTSINIYVLRSIASPMWANREDLCVMHVGSSRQIFGGRPSCGNSKE
jgi:hypothetical protein